tara:strand:- start:810 stop:995 length:186 start_codon:yes stop_codon:yes gene_type:complete
MRYPIVILFSILLVGCQSVKEKTSAMGDFFEAIGSGDIKFLKKHEKSKNDDESWEEMEKND